MNRILLAVLMAGVASSALAADLPTHKSPAPPPVYGPPPFTWTGLYVGVNGGWGFGDTDHSSFGRMNGGLAGGTVGYNYQMGQFVIGYEGDFDWSGIRSGVTSYSLGGGFSGSNKLTTEDIVTERARLGYAMDRTLLFVTGGYAGMETKGSFSDNVPGSGFGSQNVWHNGGVIGAGLEYAFTNNITLKGEYLYVPQFSRTYFAGTPDAVSTGLGLSLFRAGLNYKF
jgi:outer membrane immunogenic protein